MSSIVPTYSDKFAPEHRNQVMLDRLRQQKLRAMISLAKAQQFLAETDVLIVDYNLQAIADEFEHMKKERCNNNTDMRSLQNSEWKEEKVSSSDCPCPANIGNPKDVSSCTPLVPAVGHSKRKEKGTESTPKLTTQHAEALRSKSKTDASSTLTPKDIQPINKIGGSEPTNKINEPTSKVTKDSSKTLEPTTSKTHRESSSKAATSKTSSKTKEASTSKTHEATKSTKKAASLANTDVPAPELKSKKRKRSKSKSKESKHRESKSKDSKRHKSSHKHATSSYAPTTASNAPAASSSAHTALLGSAASSLAPAASLKAHTALLGSAAPSLAPAALLSAHTALLGSAASTLVPAASSHVRTLISHAPNCDCLKYYRADKEKTLLNTSISPIKKVEAKGVQTDEKTSKKDMVTDEVKMLTKGVQTDSVIILHVGSQTVSENSPDIADEETLLLDTLPAPHSHSTAISLAKALQQINSQKTSVLERLCPTGPDMSFLSQNDVLQKIELMVEDEAEAVEEIPRVVKMETPDGDVPNTSTEVLVNNLYKDIMKEKGKGTSDSRKPKGKVTKRGLWKILDQC